MPITALEEVQQSTAQTGKSIDQTSITHAEQKSRLK